MMDSSFLTWINVGLGLYSGISFLKLMVQFGLPNHPIRFTMYLVCLCAAVYFGLKASTDFGLISPAFFRKWNVLPLVAGSVALLLQVITSVGHYSVIQLKVFSRLPLIGGLLVYSLFPSVGPEFFGLCIVLGVLFLSISVGKARYQKRIYFKMSFFVAIYFGLVSLDQYWAHIVGQLILFFSLFYFYILEQSFGVSSLVERFQRAKEGV